MTDQRFHVRTFMLSFMTLMVLSMLTFGAWYDSSSPECHYDRDGKTFLSKLRANNSWPSEDSSDFVLFPESLSLKCRLLDLLVWVYIIGFIFLMAVRFHDYKPAPAGNPTSPGGERRVSYLRFTLDYCYMHNATAILLLLVIGLDLRTASGGSLLPGLKKDISAEEASSRSWFTVPGPFALSGGAVPLSVGIAELERNARKIAIFVFAGLLGGSFGPILFAIIVWGNALILHDRDKLVSIWIHLAVPTVQALLLHSAMVSVKHRGKSSESKIALQNSVTFSWLLYSHFAMFAVWQILLQSFVAWRNWLHRGKDDGIDRVDAYSWMLSKPPGGKSGFLYRFATILGGPGTIGSKIMFVVIQALMHFVFLTLGFGPIWLATRAWDVWPLLVQVAIFLFISVKNGALVLKRWIQKLEAAGKETKKTQ